MSFLNRIRNASANQHNSWKILNDSSQLDEIDEISTSKPVVIFKHSTSCGTSAFAKHGMEAEWDFEDADLDFFYLDLLRYRSVSNEVASHYSVVHQSPQILLIKDGKAIYDTSHFNVNIGSIKKALASV
ncbi:MAG: bacillithiol system redox-active protein YtxJ [Bacteroidota bacterium]